MQQFFFIFWNGSFAILSISKIFGTLKCSFGRAVISGLSLFSSWTLTIKICSDCIGRCIFFKTILWFLCFLCKLPAVVVWNQNLINPNPYITIMSLNEHDVLTFRMNSLFFLLFKMFFKLELDSCIFPEFVLSYETIESNRRFNLYE